MGRPRQFSVGVTIGSTSITGGTSGRVLFNNAGVVGEDADMTFATDTLTVAKLTVTTGPLTLPTTAAAAVGIKTPNAGTIGQNAIYSSTDGTNGLRFKSGGGYSGVFFNPDAAVYDQAAIGGGNASIATFTGHPSFPVIACTGGGVGTSGSTDVVLHRDDSAIWANRNGTTAQEWRNYARYSDASNYVRAEEKFSVTAVTAAAGATITATGAIPARVGRIIGVATKVTTALGTGSGTTGYTVGDGSDADRWGSVTGTATTTSTDRDSYTADPVPAWSASAQDIVLTATGGNFDGTGVISVYVYYLDVQAD